MHPVRRLPLTVSHFNGKILVSKKEMTAMKHQSHTHTVLLVEDDPDDVMMIMEVLEKTPEVKTVHHKNGLDALNYLKTIKEKNNPLPCLIILDINMPVLNGKELLAIIKNEKDLKYIPVIIFTTSSNGADKEFCNRFDVAFVTKPSNLKVFNETVQGFLSHCEV